MPFKTCKYLTLAAAVKDAISGIDELNSIVPKVRLGAYGKSLVPQPPFAELITSPNPVRRERKTTGGCFGTWKLRLVIVTCEPIGFIDPEAFAPLSCLNCETTAGNITGIEVGAPIPSSLGKYLTTSWDLLVDYSRIKVCKPCHAPDQLTPTK